jgi:hypothetical protein
MRHREGRWKCLETEYKKKRKGESNRTGKESRREIRKKKKRKREKETRAQEWQSKGWAAVSQAPRGPSTVN